jgi:hypothetical protein
VARLSIPKDHQIGLVRLQALSVPTATVLLAAIVSAAEKTQSGNLSTDDLVGVGYEGIPLDQLESILDALDGVYHARAVVEMPLDQFVKDIAESLRSLSLPNVRMSENETRQFEERLTQFMSVPGIARAAKGNILMYERERTVHGFRILTDARPIFGDDVEKPPEAIEITHTLKITYHQGTRHEEEYFALDEADLAELGLVVERAELKAKSLRAALSKSGIKILREE